MLGLLITLALVGLLIAAYMKHHNNSVRASLEKQHIDLPAGVDFNKSADVEKYVNQQIQSANAIKEKSLACATDPSSCEKPASANK